MSRLLSIVISAANDDYNDDNIYRLETTLNLSGAYLDALNLSNAVEFLLVDYGSEKPLVDAIKLSNTAQKITKFLYVSSRLKTFNIPLAQNVGIKNSRSKFVAIQALDLLLPMSAWSLLCQILSEKVPLSLSKIRLDNRFLLTPRRMLPRSFFAERPNIEEIDALICSISGRAEIYSDYFPSVGSGAGMIIGSTKLWDSLHGCDERYIGWGFTDNDLVVRASRIAPVVDLGSHGIFHYKPEYSLSGRRRTASANMVPIERNPWWINPSILANPSDWGTADCRELKYLPHSEVPSSSAVCRGEPRSVKTRFPDSISLTKEQLQQIFADRPVTHLQIYEAVLHINWYVTEFRPQTVIIAGADRDSSVTRTLLYCCQTVNLTVMDVQDIEIIGIEPGGLLELTKPLKDHKHIGMTWLLSGVEEEIVRKYLEHAADHQPNFVIIKTYVFPHWTEFIRRLSLVIRRTCAVILIFDVPPRKSGALEQILELPTIDNIQVIGQEFLVFFDLVCIKE